MLVQLGDDEFSKLSSKLRTIKNQHLVSSHQNNQLEELRENQAKDNPYAPPSRRYVCSDPFTESKPQTPPSFPFLHHSHIHSNPAERANNKLKHPLPSALTLSEETVDQACCETYNELYLISCDIISRCQNNVVAPPAVDSAGAWIHRYSEFWFHPF